MRKSRLLGLVAFAALSTATQVLYAQAPPPIHGVTGTVATDQSTRDQRKVANKIAVAADDAVEHVKGVVSHQGKSLSDLKPGTTVVVHIVTDAGSSDRLNNTEGMVTKVDRGKNEISIRYDNRKTERLTLTDRAGEDAGQDFKNAPAGTTRIVEYYSDEAGRKVAHYFTQK